VVEDYLPQNLTGEGEGYEFAWCSWTIDISMVTWDVGPVDLQPVANGLNMSGTLSNLKADVSATAPDLLCPDAIGTVYIDNISLEANLDISLSASKAVLVDVTSLEVSVVEPDVDLTGGVLSLFDFLFSWFNDSFKWVVESAIENAVVNIVAPTIQSALESFTVLETTFQLPTLPILGVPPLLTVGVQPQQLQFTSEGATVILSSRVTAPGGLPTSTIIPGSLARGDCMLGQPTASLTLPKTPPVAIGLHDDLMNQVLFAGWWSGAFHRDIPGQPIVDRLGLDGIDITTVTVAPSSPPVVTSCGPDGKLQLQIGDLSVSVDATVSGQSTSVLAMVSAAASIQVSAVTGTTNGTLDLAIEIMSVETLVFDILTASGYLDGSEQLLPLVLEKVLESIIDDVIGAGLGTNFPVPSLDLGVLIPGVPDGSAIGFAPSSFSTGSGYTLLSGALKGPEPLQ
ncbi:MAG: hypothetical protein VX223_01965, partial [Myxococcota bacterium]|nr:hypothetical protein [Myxococcota bacterium]